jgi:CDP-diacylglycerol--glycerol-3-phosphate 3-phosphatidyltransferase
MANLITLSRLILLFVVVVIAYRPLSVLQFVNVPLLIVLFVTDAVDGYVARRLNEASVFGAMFDIASDRIVEYTLWIIFADLDLVPIWVPLIFVFRGTIVDTIRSSHVRAEGESPFAMMRSTIGKWLVGGTFMRIFYAVIKAVAFCWLALIQPLATISQEFWAERSSLLIGVSEVLVYLAVGLCLLRGLPVIIEFVYAGRPVKGKTL